MPGVTKHLVHRRDTSSYSCVTSTFQQRSSERFRCQTRQKTAPPLVVRDLGARWDFWCRLRLVLCQTLHESLRFSKPSLAHFACNDHHPCFSPCPTQFRVPMLLPLPGVPQSDSFGCVCFPQRRSISIVRRHQCRAQSQLHSSKEGQSFCNHLQPARIRNPLLDVQLSHHEVGGHPVAHPPPCCSVMAENVKRTATRTETAGEGNGKRRRRSNGTLNDCESYRMTS